MEAGACEVEGSEEAMISHEGVDKEGAERTGLDEVVESYCEVDKGEDC